MRCLFLILALSSLGASVRAESAASPIAPDKVAAIKKWISQQSNVHTLSANFVQTRRLRVLRDPVARPGHFWFEAPGSFRWELGTPAGTIALRHAGTFYLISVKDKKATTSDLSVAAAKSGVPNLSMMEFPMAASYEDFAKRFEIRRVELKGANCEVEVLPRDPRAQKYLQRIVFTFDTQNGNLAMFEIDFRDGSAMRNDFSNIQVNRRMEPGIFDFDFTGYSVTRGKN